MAWGRPVWFRLPRQVMWPLRGEHTTSAHQDPGSEYKWVLSSLSKITKWRTEVSGFQERLCGVISARFSALSPYLTKAARGFHCRIRLVAFLWPLTSGAFGLCLESQWSNRRVCHFAERSIDCGKGNNAFSFPEGESAPVLWSILSRLWLQLWPSSSSKSFWNHGRRMYVWFPISSWKETKCSSLNVSEFIALDLTPDILPRTLLDWAFVIKCLHCFYYPRIEQTVLVLLFFRIVGTK